MPDADPPDDDLNLRVTPMHRARLLRRALQALNALGDEQLLTEVEVLEMKALKRSGAAPP